MPDKTSDKTSDKKVRIAKDLQGEVTQWAELLNTTEPKFVNEAIRFYIRFLQGHYHSIGSTFPTSQNNPSRERVEPNDETNKDDSDYIGNLDTDW